MDYTHQPDFLHWMLGERPVGIFASAGQGGAPELTSNPNFINLNCDYDRPLIGTIHLNYLQMPERHEYEVVGDRGWAMFDLNTGQLRRGERVGAREWTEQFPVERDPVYEAEHQAFLDTVAGRRRPESPAADAIQFYQFAAEENR
jgi:predicted dehydrogenase